MTLHRKATAALASAFSSLGLPSPGLPLVRAPRPEFGDLACTEALGLARSLGRNPREVGHSIAAALEGSPLFSRVAVEGAGYVNLTFSDASIDQAIRERIAGDMPAVRPGTVLVDFGGPNAAKDLHVGHLRSGVIGDTLMRIGRELGHRMSSDLHAGDWGLPMGMLLAELGDQMPPDTVEGLNALYVSASRKCDESQDALDAARAATVALQNEEPAAIAKWKVMASLSVQAALKVFGRLGIAFDHAMGESDARLFVEETERRLKRLLREDDGAQVVATEEGNLVFRKGDDGLTYAATDLATIVQRTYVPAPDLVLYVVDDRQSKHFRQVFEVARKALVPPTMALEHVGFGTVDGPGGKPLKTRDGGVPKLAHLLDAAVGACLRKLVERGVGPREAAESAEILGIGAVRFADLSTVRESGYAFDLAQMTSADGRTGPYLAYGVTRARGVVRKAVEAGYEIGAPVVGGDAHRRAVLMAICGYGDALLAAWERRAPHHLCNHALEVASAVNALYQARPVIRETDMAERASLLGVLDLAESHLTKVMSLLGVGVPERM